MLFSAESPPMELTKNKAGDNVMRGTTCVESMGHFTLKKIVIKEVSSHFRNGVLFLVILCRNQLNVKPLICENFRVKARKTVDEGKMRKFAKVK